MAAVRSGDTAPELVVRSMLHKAGFRFRLHRNDLPGKPDILLPKHRTAILVHGCFWHQHPGCKYADRPTTHEEYWHRKLNRNIERDKKTRRELEAEGWKVIVVWECETRNSELLRERLLKTLRESVKDEVTNDKTR